MSIDMSKSLSVQPNFQEFVGQVVFHDFLLPKCHLDTNTGFAYGEYCPNRRSLQQTRS